MLISGQGRLGGVPSAGGGGGEPAVTPGSGADRPSARRPLTTSNPIGPDLKAIPARALGAAFPALRGAYKSTAALNILIGEPVEALKAAAEW